jgi:hypothetical protein
VSSVRSATVRSCNNNDDASTYTSTAAVLRTTTISYGNKRFSGTYQTETSQLINMKFCVIDYVGEDTCCAKNGWYQLAGVAPLMGEIYSQKLFFLYFTLFIFVSLCRPDGLTDLHARYSLNDAVC